VEGHHRYQTEEQRREVVARWRASGLSQRAFCRQDCIPEWVLSTWKRLDGKSNILVPTQKKRQESRSRQQSQKHQQPASFRKTMILEQAASGLSVAEFCKRNRIGIGNFWRWRRSLSAEAKGISKPAISAAHDSNPFVAVRLAAPEDSVPIESAVEVILPGGSKIRVTDRTPLDRKASASTVSLERLHFQTEKCRQLSVAIGAG
jgi:hypothetical protein